jgi:L-amino acid N-acyltransferase YncA
MNPVTNLSIHIRAAIDSDLPEIVSIYNDAIPARMATADLEPITVDSRRAWFHDRDRRKYPIWVAEAIVNQSDAIDHDLVYNTQNLGQGIDQQNPNYQHSGRDLVTSSGNDYKETSQNSSTIAGWLSVQTFYGRCAYEGTVEVSIYVANRYQGKGIGKELLSYAIAAAPQIGITSMLGMIFAHNQPSLQLFTKLGFERWGHLPQIARLDGVKRDLVIVGLHLPNL